MADKGDKDRFGRFLRYTWKANGEFFNEKLATRGYAKAVLIAPNDRYITQIRAAEAEARAAKRGLWAACATPAPVPPASGTTQPRIQPLAPGTGCEPPVPDLCVAQYPPDLDCKDVGRKGFRVLEPDPPPASMRAAFQAWGAKVRDAPP